ncbi:hypothetical protein SAMN05421805_11817 [Saccharopolyspora antimicrobica]|uniref:Uncharacterized protein n=1 Tax=Saccharopolyspora antimicrobica TaxID=455193 RepID=A0A1I5I9U6_9PSEU|nr:hypothetical protein [Saccharopolyspora antimicrobica]RKT85582.1 hypothetical protein ATL45_3929 [Saccharopolyspora antimicrobica]SFO57354.1 hypothetical protein SAMN05421805_11817 [Saccharopolyspora antimicrobica]
MGSFSAALVVMAVVVLGSAVVSGLVIVADEVRMRRKARPEVANDDWQEAVHDVVFRD